MLQISHHSKAFGVGWKLQLPQKNGGEYIWRVFCKVAIFFFLGGSKRLSELLSGEVLGGKNIRRKVGTSDESWWIRPIQHPVLWPSTTWAQQHSRRGLCWKFAFHSQVISFLLFAEPQRYGLFSPQAGTIWVMPPILNIHYFLKKNYLPHPQRMPNCPVTSHLKFYTLVLIHIFVLLSKLVYSLQSCMLP